MLRASKRIVIVTERVNKYHFRALIDGIDLSAFESNPIMLWMHNRAFGDKNKVFLPLGNVIELKKETLPDVGYALTGLPVFDDTDDFAVSIFNKYENGTIRMASAGLVPVEWSEEAGLLLPAQRGATLVKSILEEVSIVDIGADPNALAIALYNDNHELIQLSSNGENVAIPLITNPLIKKEMSKIELTAEKAAVLLGLKNVGTTDEFESKVLEVVQLAHSQKTQIEKLTQDKATAEENLRLAQEALKKAEEGNLKEDTKIMLSAAQTERRITAEESAFYLSTVKDKAGYDALKLHLSKIPAVPTAQNAINANNGTTDEIVELCKKSYDDLFKSNKLETVKLSAPDEYKRIFKAKFGKEPKN